MESSLRIGDLVVVSYPAFRGDLAIIKRKKQMHNGNILYYVLMLESKEEACFSESCLKEIGNN
jgi:acyl CoA:acetate/3-ketoacid CoA transferase alpha subunit